MAKYNPSVGKTANVGALGGGTFFLCIVPENS